MWPFNFKKHHRLVTTLPVGHPLNYINVEADPVVIYHPTLGQVVVLVEAPAPYFLPDQLVFVEGVRVFDLADVDVVPSYYYQRTEEALGYYRT